MSDFLARGGSVPDDAPSGDVAVRSAGLLARNLEGQPFAWRADEATRARAASLVESAWSRSDGAEASPLSLLDTGLRRVLAERDAISDSYSHDPGGWIGWRAAQGAWITSNETDHVRVRCELPGLDPEGVLATLEELEGELSASLRWSFDRRYGFLGPDPAGIGHGLVLSVSLHLPALAMTLAVEREFHEALAAGMEIIGQSPEAGTSTASVWTVAYRCPPEITTSTAAGRLRGICDKLAGAERTARKQLGKRDRLGLEDAVSRAFGLSRYARTMRAEEAMEAASFLRLGDELGLVSGMGPGRFANALRGLTDSGLSLSGIAPDRSEARRRALAFAAALEGVSLAQEWHGV